MAGKRKQHTAAFKVQVALAALKQTVWTNTMGRPVLETKSPIDQGESAAYLRTLASNKFKMQGRSRTDLGALSEGREGQKGRVGQRKA
jgi:hypothetical protein